uniref:Reverse transcriptase domain-containing protein n=1 Tax=Fagus sylvatica TaxID=28930 RepID=A0A2N9FQS3_FAGSY
MKLLASSIGFSKQKIVGACGKASGVCFMWSFSLSVKLLEFDSHTIAIFAQDDFCAWSLIGFYGPPYQAKRCKAWGNLHALLQSLVGPWMCFGDFNIIVEDSEKEGGSLGSSSTPNFLRELLFDLAAIDLGFSSNKYTWWNKRWGLGAIRERLDRAIANVSWRLAFPKAAVTHLGAINSDHAPLLIDTNPIDEYCPRPFRFEAMWTKDHQCGNVIKEAWSTRFVGSHPLVFYCKQAKTISALKKWNRDSFGHCQTRIKEILNQIEEEQLKERTECNARLEARLQRDLNEWLRRNEVMWKQKSREMWLKDGDKNSKFFHLSTIICRKRNSIDAVKDDVRNSITCKKEIRAHMVEKFKVLFTEESVNFPQDLEDLIMPSVTDQDNACLCRIPSLEEIKATIFEINSHKAPGLDGLSALFYKRYWSIVGSSVIKAIQSFFLSGRLHAEETFINWIMECVSSTSLSVLVNEGSSKSFPPTRGLRQGDPLFHYLFILCQEVLSRLINRAQAVGSIRGVKMNTGGPDFTNVMFADDIMLFSKASCSDVQVLNSCLEKYCDWFGQLINRTKLGIFFSKLVQPDQKRRIKRLLQMKKALDNSTYLGVPLFSSRIVAKDFKYLQDKMEARLKGWRCKSLSWAGRCTLIKSVAQAIPTYAFSTFDVPVGICDKLDAATRRKAKDFNDVLLAKLTWMIASKRDSLCMVALRSRYKVFCRLVEKRPSKTLISDMEGY